MHIYDSNTHSKNNKYILQLCIVPITVYAMSLNSKCAENMLSLTGILWKVQIEITAFLTMLHNHRYTQPETNLDLEPAMYTARDKPRSRACIELRLIVLRVWSDILSSHPCGIFLRLILADEPVHADPNDVTTALALHTDIL